MSNSKFKKEKMLNSNFKKEKMSNSFFKKEKMSNVLVAELLSKVFSYHSTFFPQ